MRTLFFDVSTNVMYVGLAKDDILIDYSIRFATHDHAKYLVDRIDQVLKRNKLRLDQIDELIIGYGPGSYTGIRIAVVVGKMLAYAKAVKLRIVSSLFFMTSGYEGKVAALIDARRGYVFSGIYENGKTILEDDYRLLADLKTNELYQTAQTVFIDDRSFLINPKRIREKSVEVIDVHGLEPNYLRKTEAENNANQKSDN
ncbi:MAG: tRNA (adenosine(37)-N6)-threonylcarbamoyltransferase complex dimerization subunit type 1 TsaB [Acholeplasmataceae bacterium]|jgi:tRNA threonylcarbamoyladenosine biosynthesis protein TsaB|nr:tRNA (adenosine(37)-N6)-threonylcarbamoyltransferase complex dimerization subunit type 1 TsaB [Acholeplasmataceae bacterium]